MKILVEKWSWGNLDRFVIFLKGKTYAIFWPPSYPAITIESLTTRSPGFNFSASTNPITGRKYVCKKEIKVSKCTGRRSSASLLTPGWAHGSYLTCRGLDHSALALSLGIQVNVCSILLLVIWVNIKQLKTKVKEF